MQNEVGVVTGLAWTEVGGDLLSIEATVVPGKGKLLHTGQLGEVMQESIQAALSVVRARADRLGIDPDFHQKLDVHVHVPEGATPKDGPSAGIAMCTALVSALTKVPVRADVAMTGEITLRGRVLPIGGLKEKLLAAHRGGIKTVLIPDENLKDLAEIPKNITESLDIRAVKWIDEVLDLALEKPLVPAARNEPTTARRGREARARRGRRVRHHAGAAALRTRAGGRRRAICAGGATGPRACAGSRGTGPARRPGAARRAPEILVTQRAKPHGALLRAHGATGIKVLRRESAVIRQRYSRAVAPDLTRTRPWGDRGAGCRQGGSAKIIQRE